MTTAGRSVVFAGTTVVIAVLGLLAMGFGLINGLAVGIAAMLMTMLASLTLLPALLGFAGHRIDRFGLPHRSRHDDGHTSLAHRWSRTVQRRPLPYALGALGLLVTLPRMDMRLGFADASTVSPRDTSRQAYELLAEGFGPGFNGPLVVAADLSGAASPDAGLRAAERLSTSPTPPAPGCRSSSASCSRCRSCC